MEIGKKDTLLFSNFPLTLIDDKASHAVAAGAVMNSIARTAGCRFSL